MARRRKRRKNTILNRRKVKQSSIETQDPIEVMTTQAGIPVKKVRHTLTREEDFLNIYLCGFKDKPVDLHESTLADHTFNTVRDKAQYYIDEWNCDWDAIEASVAKRRIGYENIIWDGNCGEIYRNFSYQKMGLIYLYEAPFKHKDGRIEQSLIIQNGQHRSSALGCLLLQEKIKWQPIPYWLWTVPEHIKVHLQGDTHGKE